MLFKLLVFILTLFICLSSPKTLAQQVPYTHSDTLRGSVTPERAWWDLTFYHLRVRPNNLDSTITGQNEIRYKVLSSRQRIQIDLQVPLNIEKVEQDGESLSFNRDGNAYFITLNKKQKAGRHESLTVFYSGKPRLARRPPWDGGIQWEHDRSKNDWISTSCQGVGSSVWWPCKDHMYDEPDSMEISITVSKKLSDISNGQLKSVIPNADGTHTFNWFVKNPINNYGVNMNVGEYEGWKEVYKGEKGDLNISYYALRQDIEKAREQYKQVPMMLKAFEHWFGPYPFYEDGYKLVQVPYLGMEHQSSITYGNQFKNGYLGRDLSGTGWGLKWDFIIVHESGHEWFANNITYKDVADMWVHESFTNYSENLYTEYYYGKQAGSDYVIGTRKLIANDIPIVGVYGVNKEGSRDMYYKGGNMLHTIRQIINDDDKWREILRGLNKTFYHQTVYGSQIESYISEKSDKDLSKVFDQYLRDIRIPVLEYAFRENTLEYRWTNVIDGFAMPIKIKTDSGKEQLIVPGTGWKKLKWKASSIDVDPNFYVESREIK